MIALYIIAFVLAVIGIIFVLKITPEQINNDITDLFGKEETLKDKSLSARGKKKKSKILLELEHLHRALKETGKEKQFSFACALSALLMVAGCVIAIAIDNVFLIPVLAVGYAPQKIYRTVLRYCRLHIFTKPLRSMRKESRPSLNRHSRLLQALTSEAKILLRQSRTQFLICIHR